MFILDILLYLAIASFTYQFVKRNMFSSAVLAALIAFTFGLLDSVTLANEAYEDEMGYVLAYVVIGMVVTGVSVAYIRSKHNEWKANAPVRQAEEDRILEKKVNDIIAKREQDLDNEK